MKRKVVEVEPVIEQDMGPRNLHQINFKKYWYMTKSLDDGRMLLTQSDICKALKNKLPVFAVDYKRLVPRPEDQINRVI